MHGKGFQHYQQVGWVAQVIRLQLSKHYKLQTIKWGIYYLQILLATLYGFAFLFALISRAGMFDKWVKASPIEEHFDRINLDDPYKIKKEIDFVGIFLLLALAFTATDIAKILSSYYLKLR